MIEHKGKDHPDLPPDTLVEVYFRDGSDQGKNNPMPVSWWYARDPEDRDYWLHNSGSDDIVGYEVVTWPNL